MTSQNRTPPWWWEYLNSQVASWFLGSVVLGLAALLYGSCQDARRTAADRQLRARQLTLEVEYRISQAIDSLLALSVEADSTYALRKGVSRAHVAQLVHSLVEAPGASSRGILSMYREYETRPLVGLYAELLGLQSDGQDSSAVTRAINRLGQRSALSPYFELPEELAAELLELRAPKTQGTFAFTDCGTKKPFC